MACLGLVALPVSAFAQDALRAALYPAGATQVEYTDPTDDDRPLNYLLIYPAAPTADTEPFKVFLSANLQLHKDAPVAAGGLKHPLVIFSHGAGGNGSNYAWFGQYLAARGYFVALIYHYRAHTYDISAVYLRNRLWQRPHDIHLHISHLLQDEVWGKHIDPDRIGIAGHSQGGFTSLWIGGAEVDPEGFEAFQRGWQGRLVVPAYLRAQMIPDAKPALNHRDERVKAAFAMAPGDIQSFGMDADGLRQVKIPTYLMVGDADTATPAEDNAAFAAQHVPQAELEILTGGLGHEIFVNECDEIGRDNYRDSCIDPPGVERARLHQHIGDVALRFFDRHLGVKRQTSDQQ